MNVHCLSYASSKLYTDGGENCSHESTRVRFRPFQCHVHNAASIVEVKDCCCLCCVITGRSPPSYVRTTIGMERDANVARRVHVQGQSVCHEGVFTGTWDEVHFLPWFCEIAGGFEGDADGHVWCGTVSIFLTCPISGITLDKSIRCIVTVHLTHGEIDWCPQGIPQPLTKHTSSSRMFAKPSKPTIAPAVKAASKKVSSKRKMVVEPVDEGEGEDVQEVKKARKLPAEETREKMLNARKRLEDVETKAAQLHSLYKEMITETADTGKDQVCFSHDVPNLVGQFLHGSIPEDTVTLDCLTCDGDADVDYIQYTINEKVRELLRKDGYFVVKSNDCISSISW